MSSILVLLESFLQTCMTYTIAECTVNKLLMMDRRTVRNMQSFMTKYICEISASSWFYYKEKCCCQFYFENMAPSAHKKRQLNIDGRKPRGASSQVVGHTKIFCAVCKHSSWETQNERIFFTVAIHCPRNTQTLTAGCFLCGTKVSLEQNPKIIVHIFF